MTPATRLLTRTLAALPATAHDPLQRTTGPGAEAVPVPFAAVRDPDWLAEQLRLRGRRWHTDDRRVLATLWWYSLSNWFQIASIASLVATGRALSPRVDDVTLHWLPDSRVVGGTSAAVLPGPEPVSALGTALRETLDEVIPLVAAAGAMRERPLWAISTDSTANRFLWAAAASGDRGRAVGLAGRVCEAVGAPLPAPRFLDVVPVDPDLHDRPDLGTAPFTRRASCCLLVQAPGQAACGACPGRPPADRLLRMRRAAYDRALEP